MSNNALYEALQKSAMNPEKRRKGHDSVWFLPDQRGSFVIHEFKDISKDMSRRAIVVGEILESHPQASGAICQQPGTMVKKFYDLSAHTWVIDQMMNDICDITGADPKAMSGDEVKALFTNVFENQALRGVVVNFRTQTETMNKKTKQKREKPFTSVYFSEARGPVDADGVPTGDHVNTAERIAERAAKLPKSE